MSHSDNKLKQTRAKRGDTIGGQRRPSKPLLPHLGVAIRSHAMLLLLVVTTLVLKSLIYAPISIWPLAYICLIPWLIVVGTCESAPRVYFYSYLLGAVFFLINVRWLAENTGPWYAPFALYLGVYFPMMACPLRHVVRRRRLPLAIVLPIIWTGGEWLRSIIISGFPWFYISHSQYTVLPMLQISDLVGAYGVTFVVAAVNGALADVILARWSAHRAIKPQTNRNQAWIGSSFAVILVVFTLSYGWYRLNENTISDGPRIAVIQGDYPDTVNGSGFSAADKRDAYLQMMNDASDAEPDLYLLPESAWPANLNAEFRSLKPEDMMRSRWMKYAFGESAVYFNNAVRWSQSSFEYLSSFAHHHDAYVVIGAGSLYPTPFDLKNDIRNHNSAFVFGPDGGEPEIYNKRHLVYFGETVPFRFGRLRPLYFWFNAITPYGGRSNWEFSQFAGESFHTMGMTARSMDDQPFHFGTPICYEDVMPYVSREFTMGDNGEKRVDFLLNISNDGWFGRGGQQAQHFAICVMRAVENRVGIARSVNTGISGFINPDGRVHHQVGADRKPSDGYGTGVQIASIQIDTRVSFYSRNGDWFAITCAVLWLLFYIDYVVIRAIARHRDEFTEQS